MITCVLFGQENERKKEEKDERKRKYNVRWNDEVLDCVLFCSQFVFNLDPCTLCSLLLVMLLYIMQWLFQVTAEEMEAY